MKCYRRLQRGTNPKRDACILPVPSRITQREFAKGYSDIIRSFYWPKPFQLRLSVSLPDIQEILGLTCVEAWKVTKEIRAMPWKSKYSFISVKDLATYMKVPEWRVQFYYYNRRDSGFY